jgi:hypothetical protein
VAGADGGRENHDPLFHVTNLRYSIADREAKRKCEA